jgi:hypothetical protein
VATTAPPPTKTVTLTIDGQEGTVAEGTTIWDVGGRVYAAACVRPCEVGMGGDPQDAGGGASP